MIARAAFALLAVAVAAQLAGAEQPVALDEAVRLALERNLDLTIERLNPLIAREQRREAVGAFDPIASAGVNYGQTERFVNSILELSAPNGVIRERTVGIEYPSLAGRLITGTQYSLGLSSPIVRTNNPLRLYDESYQPVLTFGLTQPLLRDFGIEVNMVRVRQAEKAEAQALFALEARMLGVIRDVETRYWALFLADQHVAVARGSLELAEDLVGRLTRALGAGLATPLDVAEARAALAARQGDLAVAGAELQAARTQLRLVVDPQAGGAPPLAPTEEPPEAAPPSDLAASLGRALVHRPELRQQEALIDKIAIEERTAKNNTQWRLDALGSLGWDGLAGRGVNPVVRSPLPAPLQGRDTYADSFQNFLSPSGNVNWSIGLRLQLPIGNNEAEARLAQVRYVRQQEEVRLLQLRAQIGGEVETAFQETAAMAARRAAGRDNVAVAQAQVEAQERELGAGRTTVRKVLEAQDALARARDVENRARVEYAIARARLDAADVRSFDTYRLSFRR